MLYNFRRSLKIDIFKYETVGIVLTGFQTGVIQLKFGYFYSYRSNYSKIKYNYFCAILFFPKLRRSCFAVI